MSLCSLPFASVLSLLPHSIHGTFRLQSSWAPHEVLRPLPCVQPAFLLCLLPSFVSLSSYPPFNYTSLYIFTIYFLISVSTLLSPLLPACYSRFLVQRQKVSFYNSCYSPTNTVDSSLPRILYKQATGK